MKEPYTAVIKHSGAWWIGWIEEVPGVNCQEATRDELLETLRITLREALSKRAKTDRSSSRVNTIGRLAGFLARWTPTSRPNQGSNLISDNE